MAHSWTRLQTAQTCGQKYKWRYQKGYVERPSAASRPLVLGSAVHKGIETYLRVITEVQHELEFVPDIEKARAEVDAFQAVRDYIKGETRPNQQRYDDKSGLKAFDSEYYEMMREVEKTAVELLEFYLPTIPATWRIATKGQVIPGRYEGNPQGDELALEWKIYHDFPMGEEFTGIVDAVIHDSESGATLLVDWKVKGNFPLDDKAALDGQLHLYAAVLNEHGAAIREVCMYQMKSTLPANAEISAVTGEPLTGRSGYATTWEHWRATLPMGVDASKFEDKMRPKMKDMSYFLRPIYSPVTRHSTQFALDNAHQAVRMVDNNTLPAKLSSYDCNFCPYFRLCDALKYGGNVEMVVDLAYDREEPHG